MDPLTRRTMPIVGIGSLVLGGACSSAPSVQDIASRICEFDLLCGEFYYSSLPDCERRLGAEIQAGIDENRTMDGADCADAYLEYYDCYSIALDPETCRENESACVDAYLRVARACGL